MARILVVEDRVPAKELGSGYPRSFEILGCLRELGHEVTLFPLLFPDRLEPHTSQLEANGIEVICSTPSNRLEFHDFFQKRKDHYDWVWISRPHNMSSIIGTIESIKPKQKIIYDAEALYAMRRIRMLELYGTTLSPKKKMAMIRAEINLMNHAELVIAVSENEKRIMEPFCIKPISVLGHAVDAQPTPKPFNQRRDILFVGRFSRSSSPNEDAMLYFVKEIFPTVWKETGANLWIVGSNDSQKIRNLASDHIKVTGRRERLFDYYNDCKLFVVPTRYAAGIPLKLLECLSHGLPAVVSTLIAEQLNLNEELVFVGKDTKELSHKIISCYSDEKQWNVCRENGLEWVKKQFNREMFIKTIRELFLGQ